MVAINIKYTAEELEPKSAIFFCGAGLIKCQIVSSEKGKSRFATEEKPKPETLKVHYIVADGEYQGNENTIEFDLWDDSDVDFGNGKSAPASKLAAQNFVALCVAAGFESFVADSNILNGKQLLINHEIEKGKAIEEVDDYGNKKSKLDENGQPEFYPDRSNVVRRGKKFARINGVSQPQAPAAVTAIAPTAPAAAPVAAPVAPQAPAVTYTPPPAAPAIDDEIPWA